jgi:predicted NUDIX family phosphoesterase
MNKDDERVLCVPRSALEAYWGGGLFQGFHGNSDPIAGRNCDLLTTVLREDVAKFVRRGDCEQDPSLKQIIPYVMLTCDCYGTRNIFRYNRAVKGEGEQRLAGKATIGIGGHINDADHSGNFYETFQIAWRRELYEEVLVESPFRVHMRGFVNDDRDSVGSVHFGVLIELQLDLPCVYPNEPNIVQPHFMPLDFYTSDLPLNFEGWSEIVLQYAFKQVGVR